MKKYKFKISKRANKLNDAIECIKKYSNCNADQEKVISQLDYDVRKHEICVKRVLKR